MITTASRTYFFIAIVTFNLPAIFPSGPLADDNAIPGVHNPFSDSYFDDDRAATEPTAKKNYDGLKKWTPVVLNAYAPASTLSAPLNTAPVHQNDNQVQEVVIQFPKRTNRPQSRGDPSITLHPVPADDDDKDSSREREAAKDDDAQKSKAGSKKRQSSDDNDDDRRTPSPAEDSKTSLQRKKVIFPSETTIPSLYQMYWKLRQEGKTLADVYEGAPNVPDSYAGLQSKKLGRGRAKREYGYHDSEAGYRPEVGELDYRGSQWREEFPRGNPYFQRSEEGRDEEQRDEGRRDEEIPCVETWFGCIPRLSYVLSRLQNYFESDLQHGAEEHFESMPSHSLEGHGPAVHDTSNPNPPNVPVSPEAGNPESSFDDIVASFIMQHGGTIDKRPGKDRTAEHPSPEEPILTGHRGNKNEPIVTEAPNPEKSTMPAARGMEDIPAKGNSSKDNSQTDDKDQQQRVASMEYDEVEEPEISTVKSKILCRSGDGSICGRGAGREDEQNPSTPTPENMTKQLIRTKREAEKSQKNGNGKSALTTESRSDIGYEYNDEDYFQDQTYPLTSRKVPPTPKHRNTATQVPTLHQVPVDRKGKASAGNVQKSGMTEISGTHLTEDLSPRNGQDTNAAKSGQENQHQDERCDNDCRECVEEDRKRKEDAARKAAESAGERSSFHQEESRDLCLDDPSSSNACQECVEEDRLRKEDLRHRERWSSY